MVVHEVEKSLVDILFDNPDLPGNRIRMNLMIFSCTVISILMTVESVILVDVFDRFVLFPCFVVA